MGPYSADRANHISVCICTYKRPKLLKRLLEDLDGQETCGLFTFSIVVVDNDSMRSAELVVSEFGSASAISIRYYSEPRRNIALARNKAVENARGDLVAFIDDDEFPARDWLCNSYKACVSYGVHGVLGPVTPHFELEPPRWVKKGRFFERPAHTTGYRMNSAETRTGNVLFWRAILNGLQAPFDPAFGTGGEDVDFFRRMIEKGNVFVWCSEAVVYEVVPISRCRINYLLKRALLRGSNFPKHKVNRLKSAAQSLIAVPCYTLALPFLMVSGRHRYVDYAIRLCDHVARLLAFLGLRLMTEREM